MEEINLSGNRDRPYEIAASLWSCSGVQYALALDLEFDFIVKLDFDRHRTRVPKSTKKEQREPPSRGSGARQ
jgi:hypothetical protein